MESLQQDLEKLYDWSQYSLLKFHPDKCVVMRIGANQKKLATNPYYNMDATRLKIVEHEKDRRLIVDSELKFEDHITRIVNKVNPVMGMIRRNFAFLDRDRFKQLFVAMAWCYSMEPSLHETNNANRKRNSGERQSKFLDQRTCHI